MSLTPELIKQLVETKVPFVERMGLKALELAPGRVKLMAPLKGNENHINSMYAGALFTVGEMPVGALYATTFDVTKYYPIIKEMTIQFKKLAKTDVTIELQISDEKVEQIVAEVDEVGKSEFALESEIKDESGEVVALCRGVYQLRAYGK